ncbi:hypothetical protein NDU88_000146 [Pleurodeles waltl]|uniref:Uncharacterized protein n=1 Tax=Pleurodeles waltl TaxID=8319 RepID=A0AAV7S6Y5_PLEWA|nr:hypothetical protein NDU88_000146 [Pleurodeles waltl]
MDPRVEEAMRLLREAGCLDLLADGGACRERPTRQAASGVAAAVAACSPPRKSGGRRAPQLRSVRAGMGRAGGAGVPSRRGVYGLTWHPGPLGARRQRSLSRVEPGAGPERPRSRFRRQRDCCRGGRAPWGCGRQ